MILASHAHTRENKKEGAFMAKHKQGRQSFLFTEPPVITAWASIAGKKESEGPLKDYFDYHFTDLHCDESSFEKAEIKMYKTSLNLVLNLS